MRNEGHGHLMRLLSPPCISSESGAVSSAPGNAHIRLALASAIGSPRENDAFADRLRTVQLNSITCQSVMWHNSRRNVERRANSAARQQPDQRQRHTDRAFEEGLRSDREQHAGGSQFLGQGRLEASADLEPCRQECRYVLGMRMHKTFHVAVVA